MRLYIGDRREMAMERRKTNETKKERKNERSKGRSTIKLDLIIFLLCITCEINTVPFYF